MRPEEEGRQAILAIARGNCDPRLPQVPSVAICISQFIIFNRKGIERYQKLFYTLI